MKNGYVCLWRKSRESMVFANPELFKLWCLCLMKANYRIGYVDIDGRVEPVKLLPGQFITGRYALHKEYYPNSSKKNKSPLTLWRMLQKLEKAQKLNIRNHNKFSIITINKWEQYQSNEQQVNNRRTTGEQQVNTNNKNKEELIRIKNKRYSASFLKFYEKYPVKKSKAKAFESWQKLKRQNQLPALNIILTAIKNQNKERQTKISNNEFCAEWKHPSTWLNQHCWEDEVDKPVTNIKTEKVFDGYITDIKHYEKRK